MEEVLLSKCCRFTPSNIASFDNVSIFVKDKMDVLLIPAIKMEIHRSSLKRSFLDTLFEGP